VIVEQAAKHGKILSFADRLNLSLVETNIRSQGGEYEFVEDPLCILFALTAYLLRTSIPYTPTDSIQASLSP